MEFFSQVHVSKSAMAWCQMVVTHPRVVTNLCDIIKGFLKINIAHLTLSIHLLGLRHAEQYEVFYAPNNSLRSDSGLHCWESLADESDCIVSMGYTMCIPCDPKQTKLLEAKIVFPFSLKHRIELCLN